MFLVQQITQVMKDEFLCNVSVSHYLHHTQLFFFKLNAFDLAMQVCESHPAVSSFQAFVATSFRFEHWPQ